MDTSETVYCARHPKVETRLRCASCGTPICHKCMVVTEVGMKCRECVRKLKTHLETISPLQYLLGGLAGFGLSLAGGLLLTFFLSMGGFLVSILGGMLLGYGLSQGIFYASGRKLGWRVQVLAALSILSGFGVMAGFLFPLLIFSPVFWVAAGTAMASALYYLK